MQAILFFAANLALATAAAPETGKVHDVVLHGGSIYDGSGGKPYLGDVAIDGDRIAYVGPKQDLVGRIDIDVHGQAIAPGFINMLAHPEESLLVDGRALSDLTQGVTLEVMGEFSMGPLNQDEGTDGGASGRHQIPGHLDHARRVPGRTGAQRHRAERGIVCRRANGENLCTR
jgi:hypothetical protein